MGIHERRFTKAVNQIIQEELQRGNLPSSREVMWRINEYLRDHNLSRPNYNFKPIRRSTLARSSDYNKTMDHVYEDLETLYENTIELHGGLDKNFNKFEVDKTKLEYEINSLENRLKELILLYGKSGFLNSVYDVFDDLEKVDVANTTVNVDIRTNEVSISDIKNTSTRIRPDGFTAFYILDEIANSVNGRTLSGSPSDALNDSLSNTWQYTITSKQKQLVGGFYYMNFDEKQVMNRITLGLHTVKPTRIRIDFTPDGLNWFALPYHEKEVEVASEKTFDFPSVEIKELRILMMKDEPDNESSSETALEYRYLFGLKHLKMFQLDFAEVGTLYSKPLVVEVPTNQNFSINKVSLMVEEELPNGTDIEYFIAMPQEDGEEVEWKAISPVERKNPKYNQIIDFKNITRAPALKFSIDPSISIGEYEIESLYTNGIKFYSIGEIKGRQVINNSERLFVGNNSWGVKHFTGQYSDHENHMPSLADWEKPLSNIKYDYVAIEDGKPGLLLNKKTHSNPESYMFTTGVFSEKSMESINVIPASTEPIAIYMNGKKLFQGIPDSKSSITLSFVNGWNEIIVLVYVKNPEVANGVTTDMVVDVRKYGSNIYSKAQPMTKVSLFDLQYNVKNNDRDKYAIRELADGTQQIVLNHATPGLQYDLYYHYVDGAAKETILFKADFYRDRVATNISPKLKSYRLRFS